MHMINTELDPMFDPQLNPPPVVIEAIASHTCPFIGKGLSSHTEMSGVGGPDAAAGCACASFAQSTPTETAIAEGGAGGGRGAQEGLRGPTEFLMTLRPGVSSKQLFLKSTQNTFFFCGVPLRLLVALQMWVCVFAAPSLLVGLA